MHDIGPAGCQYVQAIYISTSGSVINNLVYAATAVGIHLWHDATNVNIVNNTIFNTEIGILVGGGDFYHLRGPDDNTHVFNNIVYDNIIGISEHGSTGIHNSYSNNLAYRNSGHDWSLQNGNTHSKDVAADPQFMNYIREGGGDYHLKSTSPAIGAGTAFQAGIRAPETDLDGKHRREKCDIGAYQHEY